MGKTVVVRYKTRADAADENQRLVQRVFAQLAEDDPGGLRYATFRLADGVTFVHVATVEGEVNPLSKSSAFAEFQRDIAEPLRGAAGCGRRLRGRLLPLTRCLRRAACAGVPAPGGGLRRGACAGRRPAAGGGLRRAPAPGGLRRAVTRATPRACGAAAGR